MPLDENMSRFLCFLGGWTGSEIALCLIFGKQANWKQTVTIGIIVGGFYTLWEMK